MSRTDSIIVSFQLPVDQYFRAKEIAKKHGWTKDKSQRINLSSMLRDILYQAMDDLEEAQEGGIH